MKIDAQFMVVLLLIGFSASIVSGVAYRVLSRQPVAIGSNIKHAILGASLGTMFGAVFSAPFLEPHVASGPYYGVTFLAAVVFSVLLQRVFERHPPGEPERSMSPSPPMPMVRWREVQLPLWIGIAWVGLALLWPRFTEAAYFLANVRGLTQASIGGPVLGTLVAWAIALSIRELRNPVAVAAAGGFFLAWAFVLSLFFANAGGAFFILVGASLMWSSRRSLQSSATQEEDPHA